MKAFFAAFLALLQFLFTSVGVLPYKTDVDYGGTPYVEPVARHLLTLIENGESPYSIVISQNAEPAEIKAADELWFYLEEISGVELPVFSDNAQAPTGHEIIVGSTSRESELSVSLNRDALKHDGFILKAVGNNIFIAGGSARGTLYGVYTFLEEQLGCRWFTPKVSYIPEMSTVCVNAELDDLQNPSFELRRNSALGTNERYQAQKKCNVSYWTNNPVYGGALTYVLWDVTLTKLVPDSLFDEHPEYFAYLSETGTRSNKHVCLSNPDILEIAVENAERYIDANTTNAKHIHIGQKDNTDYCECENCTALYEYYGSVSATTVIFANKLQEALAEDGYDDMYVTFYAYNETRNPPTKNGLVCNERVIPVICGSHQACHSHPYYECGHIDGEDTTFMGRFGDGRLEFKEAVEIWTDIAERTYVYEYTINFLNSQQFFANFATLQPNAKWMMEEGITGITYTCGDGHEAAFNDLRNYLISKIEWDVNCDVEYHMMDFLKAFYGKEAAKYIKEFIDLYTAKVTATTHAFDFEWHYQSCYFTLGEIKRIDEMWKNALACDLTERQRFEVEKSELSWRYYKANLWIGEYSFFNLSGRAAENEKLYDDFKSHGLTHVTSVGGPMPEKREVDFFWQRPIDWRQ